ncbi:MAG TPA: molybdenum cofactor biosynthesis protein MoaE [Acetobacteraceae bacterium]|nr:molybdenum cofactor biosynthesis protein MoaE [Acetobacteraceae bacterium]
MARVLVQEQDFDPGAEIARLVAGRTGVGGIGCFIGTVRDSAEGRRITALTLEHYPAMTDRALRAIAAEAERRWPLLGCTIIHRVGRLEPGANIVLVLAASAHRAAALEATGFLIDWLKTKAPFWKKESFAEGGEAWVAACDADEAAAARWSS